MTDSQRSTAQVSPIDSPVDRSIYRIMRKGSRYNILGPHGRIFAKYRSAGTVGPRWEELTHTPWPYDSSAYTRGVRLWELGLIERTQVGAQEIMVAQQTPPEQAAAALRPAPEPDAAPESIVSPLAMFALPAPTINLEEHERVLDALKHEPALLFTARIQQALRDEVLYHRSQARWARHLLNLLKRYERQERRRRPAAVDSITITQKHVAWQAQQINMAAIASLSC